MAVTHPKVTNEIREVFLKDGVVKIPGAISAKWLLAIADMADKELSEPGEWVTDTNPGAAENRLFTSRYRWKTDPLVNGSSIDRRCDRGKRATDISCPTDER